MKLTDKEIIEAVRELREGGIYGRINFTAYPGFNNSMVLYKACNPDTIAYFSGSLSFICYSVYVKGNDPEWSIDINEACEAVTLPFSSPPNEPC